MSGVEQAYAQVKWPCSTEPRNVRGNTAAPTLSVDRDLRYALHWMPSKPLTLVILT
jgi:hypothetical protein